MIADSDMPRKAKSLRTFHCHFRFWLSRATAWRWKTFVYTYSKIYCLALAPEEDIECIPRGQHVGGYKQASVHRFSQACQHFQVTTIKMQNHIPYSSTSRETVRDWLRYYPWHRRWQRASCLRDMFPFSIEIWVCDSNACIFTLCLCASWLLWMFVPYVQTEQSQRKKTNRPESNKSVWMLTVMKMRKLQSKMQQRPAPCENITPY